MIHPSHDFPNYSADARLGYCYNCATYVLSPDASYPCKPSTDDGFVCDAAHPPREVDYSSITRGFA